MKFEQDVPEFTPVVITLATREEADELREFLENALANPTTNYREVAIELCNLFTFNYRG